MAGALREFWHRVLAKTGRIYGCSAEAVEEAHGIEASSSF